MENIASNSTQQLTQQRWSRLGFAFVICIAVIGCYLPALKAPLVFDSVKLASEPLYREAKPIWQAVTGGSRSLVEWTFAVQYGLFGPSTLAYTIVNVAIHLLAVLTLFGIARRTLSLPSMPADLRQNAVGWAFAMALLWAVHPLQTQAVTYTIQRHESLMGAMFLLTLYCVLRGDQSLRKWPWYLAAVGFSFLGMSCKSVMVMAPLVVLLFDYTLLAKKWSVLARQRWGLYLALFATSLWGLYVERGVFNPHATSSIGLGLSRVSSWEYFRTQPQVILHYLGLAIWPRTLCIDYRWPVEDSAIWIYGPGLVIIGLFVACFWALRKHPPLGFLGLAFFLILAPTSSLMPILDLAFEHRLYLPLAPLVALAVTLVYLATSKLLRDAKAQRLLQLALLLAFALGFMLRTVVRNLDYVNHERLWLQALEVNPRNDRAYNYLAGIAAERRQVDKAIALYEKGLVLRGSSFVAHVNLAVLYLQKGDVKIATEHARRAMAMFPDEPVPYFNLALCYEREGREAEAIEQYRLALARDVRYAAAHNNLALLLARRGDKATAIDHFQQAIEANPRYNTAIVNLGEIYRETGRYDAAITEYQRALRVAPNYAATHLFMGQALAKQGDTVGAISAMRRAIELAPKWTEPKLRLAWLLATTPDALMRNGEEAAMLAEPVVAQLRDADLNAVDTLAAAYAAAGRFAEAEATLRPAIDKLDENSPLLKRYDLYRQNQPYIEPR